MNDRVVLGYHGGPDASAAIGWFVERTGAEVVAVIVDVGQGGEAPDVLRGRALECGAADAVVVDARDEFAERHCLPALRADALDADGSPLVSALSWPLVAEHLTDAARKSGADAVAPACAAERPRFASGIGALAPDLRIVSPELTREEAMSWAADRGLPVAAKSSCPVHQNAWGRWAETGTAEPCDPDEVVITFDRGVPVALDGETVTFFQAVRELNRRAGAQGVGRFDGGRTGAIREAPGAVALISAHRELEDLTLERDLARFKRTASRRWSELVRDGLWFSPLKEALDAFIEHTQQHVSGEVRLVLHAGRAVVTGRRSEESLHDFPLAS
ncbi:argininosuccinate synthase [Saccharopolyspora rosea]|uniref:argininosuccinate synthase n=1 Tax=Saccharopolyspora rosea TaxID=524884 RepID=A0ABW3G2C7_9PSEU|nr:argininosuccinate synthase [Saccharopolyspora rosea]